jgi:hypothetical protein
MPTNGKSPDISSEPLKIMLKQFCIVVVFGIAFAYIEAAVVVYLRTIFYPDGFTFPLTDFGINPLWKPLLVIEIGREAATLVLILTSSWLFGKNRHQRFAYFAIIFAVWDIFYYVWLKVLIDWPGSLSDWDILFLIPVPWAGPVLAPVLISFTLLLFAVVVLYRDARGVALKVTLIEWFGFVLAGLIAVISFCIAGLHMTKNGFQSYFYWWLFAAGSIFAIVIFIKCFLKSK